jgi:hypothetical protein
MPGCSYLLQTAGFFCQGGEKRLCHTKTLLKNMTLEQKAGLCCGEGFWETLVLLGYDHKTITQFDCRDERQRRRHPWLKTILAAV